MGLAAAPWIFEGVKDLFVLAGIYLAGKAVSENAPIIADGISSAMSSDGGIPSASSFPDAGPLTASNGDAYIDHDLDADEYAAWIAANEKAEDADAEQDVTCPSGTCGAEKSPDIPDDLVGTQDKKSREAGKRHLSGPLSPSNGGTGDASKDFGKLTGGKHRNLPNGTIQGNNGIIYRPGNGTKGPRIDIPAKGNKLHETLHYP